jgi:hypothetical protein
MDLLFEEFGTIMAVSVAMQGIVIVESGEN